MQPGIFNNDLFKATVMSGDRYTDKWLNVVANLEASYEQFRSRSEEDSQPKTVTVLVDLNYDGVQIKQHSAATSNMWPILATISAIKVKNENW